MCRMNASSSHAMGSSTTRLQPLTNTTADALYSPWQNGKVERSHREDGKILYKRKVFTSERELKKQVQKHEDRYNRTAKISLDFKSPNQVVEAYFSKCNICLDS